MENDVARTIWMGLTLAAVIASAPAAATLPTPMQSAAASQAGPYLFYSGAGDAFEITSSMILLQKSQNADLRGFASMLIDHHTQATNMALATAKTAGVMAPPPELSAQQKAMIGQLIAATPTTIDRLFLTQQVAAHQQALQLQQGYAARGDVPALQENARMTLPVVTSHLQMAQQMARSMR
jgi:putative membrane protein